MNSTASNSTHDTKAGVSSALLARCRNGDREAQQTLYETCFPRVYRVIERMVGSQDAADVTQDAFIKALLDRALGSLDPELRAALLLRELGGMSYEEIADSLNIPSGTVGSRLNRARRYMQSALEELGWKP